MDLNIKHLKIVLLLTPKLCIKQIQGSETLPEAAPPRNPRLLQHPHPNFQNFTDRSVTISRTQTKTTITIILARVSCYAKQITPRNNVAPIVP